MGKFLGDYRGGVGKSGVLMDNKSGNISETRKDRGKVTIGNHQRYFERCHPRPPTSSPFPRLGVRNFHSKLQSKIAGKRLHRDK